MSDTDGVMLASSAEEEGSDADGVMLGEDPEPPRGSQDSAPVRGVRGRRAVQHAHEGTFGCWSLAPTLADAPRAAADGCLPEVAEQRSVDALLVARWAFTPKPAVVDPDRAHESVAVGAWRRHGVWGRVEYEIIECYKFPAVVVPSDFDDSNALFFFAIGGVVPGSRRTRWATDP